MKTTLTGQTARDYAEMNAGMLFPEEQLITDDSGEPHIEIENLSYRFDEAMMGDDYEGGKDGLNRVASIMSDICQAAKIPIEGMAVTDSYNGADNKNLYDWLPDYLVCKIESLAERAVELYYQEN